MSELTEWCLGDQHKERTLITADHPKADIIYRVLKKALCVSNGEKEKEETMNKILRGRDPEVLARNLDDHAKALESMFNWHGPHRQHIIEDIKITAELARQISKLTWNLKKLESQIKDLSSEKSDMPTFYKNGPLL